MKGINMSTGYEWYLNNKKLYEKENKSVIDEVNKQDSPQHILWAKTICGNLESEIAKCVYNNDGFFFTEPLVNKLMHFAYLKGSRSINENSYQDGWDDCLLDVSKKLGLNNEGN
uniref:Uncharacterized protein n=1 Tax=viral metagenome TaxID=1070528 RepID=A0A6M3K5P7_9ZZZZ